MTEEELGRYPKRTCLTCGCDAHPVSGFNFRDRTGKYAVVRYLCHNCDHEHSCLFTPKMDQIPPDE